MASTPQTVNEPPPSDAGISRKAWRGWLGAIILIALLYRTVYWFSVRSHPLFLFPVIDAAQHHAGAVRIANGGLLGSGPDDVFKPPLYPAFVGLIYALLGPKVGAVQGIQFFLGILSCLLTALLGARLFGPFVGVTAGLLSALYAPYLFFEGQLLTPALSIFLNLLIVLLGLTVDQRRVWAWLGLGALTGLAVGVRPDALIGLGAFLIYRLGRRVRRREIPQAGVKVAFLVGGLLLVLTPIAVRNYVLTASFIPVSANAGINFYTGNGPQADGFTAIPPGVAWSQTISLVPESVLLRPAAASRWWWARTLANIRQDGLRWVLLLGKKALGFWNGREFPNNISFDWFRGSCAPLRPPFLQFWFVAALGLAGVGVCLGRFKGNPDAVVPAMIIGGYFVVCVAFFVTARFRLPAVPFMIILAALTIERARDLAPAPWRTLAPFMLLLAVCIGATWPGWFPLSSPAFSRDLVNLGNVYRDQGDIPGALQAYDRAISLDPRQADALLLAGTLRLRQGKTAEALPLLKRASALYPSDVDILLNLAEAYRMEGQADRAREKYAALFRLSQTGNWYHKRASLAKAHLGLAELYAAQGQPAKARSEREQAWHTEEQTAAEYALLKGQELERAKETFARLAAQESWNWYLRANLGMAYFKLGQFPEAVRELARAAQSSDARPGVRFYLALALLRSGRRGEAQNLLKHLLTELPEGPLAEEVRRVLSRLGSP